MITHYKKPESSRGAARSARVPGAIGALAAIITLTSLSVSAEDSMRGFLKCLETQDDQARLACYDRLAAALVELGPGAPASAAAPAARPEPEAGARATIAENEFGDEQGARDGAVDSIAANVIGGFAGWNADTVFELDNGQVWQQSMPGRFEYAGPDRPITIRRAALGSFLLFPEGLNRSIRVKRIK